MIYELDMGNKFREVLQLAHYIDKQTLVIIAIHYLTFLILLFKFPYCKGVFISLDFRMYLDRNLHSTIHLLLGRPARPDFKRFVDCSLVRLLSKAKRALYFFRVVVV